MSVSDKISQKEAVYSAVRSFYSENNKLFDDGNLVSLSAEDKNTVVEIISASIMSGNVSFSKTEDALYDSMEKVRKYCKSLLSNWLRRDVRLNGGIKYKSSAKLKNSALVKELEKLMKHAENDAQRSVLKEMIEEYNIKPL